MNMMNKKIEFLLLLLICLCTFCSCGKDEEENDEMVELSMPDIRDVGIERKLFQYVGSRYYMFHWDNYKVKNVTSNYTQSNWVMSTSPLSFKFTRSWDDFVYYESYQDIVQNDKGLIMNMNLVITRDFITENKIENVISAYSFLYDKNDRLIEINEVAEGNKIITKLEWNEDGALNSCIKYSGDEILLEYLYYYDGKINNDGLYVELQMPEFGDAPFLYLSGLFGRASSMLPYAVVLVEDGSESTYELNYDINEKGNLQQIFTTLYYDGEEVLSYENVYE